MEFQKLLADLSRHKETMALALSADSMKGLLQILSKQSAMPDGIDGIRATVREIKTRILVDAQRQKVLEFFLTGQDLKQWLSRPNAKLWMSGIPGAGKTVLAGSVIEKALSATAHLKSEATCFFFCDHKDSKSLDLVNIFSSLASQLARQQDQADRLLEQYYAELHPDNALPLKPDWKRLKQYPDNIGKSIRSPCRQISYYSIAFCSRDEFHIRKALQADFGHINIVAKTVDVRRHVREEIAERIQQTTLMIRSPALKEDIINTLINKAGGMFRWVTCQLDYLCEQPMDKDIREALASFPPR
ncbi:hypothetical protein BJX65DRAFT_305409 [Aspergillus insuetus]